MTDLGPVKKVAPCPIDTVSASVSVRAKALETRHGLPELDLIETFAYMDGWMAFLHPAARCDWRCEADGFSRETLCQGMIIREIC